MTTPRLRAAPEGAALEAPRRREGAAALAGGSRLALTLEDVRHDTALGVEELVIHLVPAAELRDLEELGRDRELGLVGQVREHCAVTLRRVDLLRLLAVEEVEEGLGRRRRVRGHGRRVLDQERLVGDDVVDVLALLLRRDRLILI